MDYGLWWTQRIPSKYLKNITYMDFECIFIVWAIKFDILKHIGRLVQNVEPLEATYALFFTSKLPFLGRILNILREVLFKCVL